jgi:S-adenosylmethionine hydrolase
VPVITLLTDYGTRDSYVGELRGTLLARVPDAVLADITHEVPPGDLPAAAYVLARSWRSFPAGTIHLTVVDPGVGGARAALALESLGHFFVGPDNGVFTPVLEAAGEVIELTVPPAASATFHGRDVFAPAAAALCSGRPLSSLGPVLRAPAIRLPPPRLRPEGGGTTGEVIYVDRFGTLITNLGPALGNEIEIAGLRLQLSRTFGDVPPGEPLAFVGSGGTIEIAVRDGSAAELLGLGRGAAVRAERPR